MLAAVLKVRETNLRVVAALPPVEISVTRWPRLGCRLPLRDQREVVASSVSHRPSCRFLLVLFWSMVAASGVVVVTAAAWVVATTAAWVVATAAAWVVATAAAWVEATAA